jgi:hypothetical protein
VDEWATYTLEDELREDLGNHVVGGGEGLADWISRQDCFLQVC